MGNRRINDFHPIGVIFFFNGEFRCPNPHRTLAGGFAQERGIGFSFPFQKGTERLKSNILIGKSCGIKWGNRGIFPRDPKGRQTLSLVAIKGPQGLPIYPRNRGKKRSKRFGVLKVFDNERIIFIKILIYQFGISVI